MKIRNFVWLVLALGLTGIPSSAQKVSTRSKQGPSVATRASALDTSIATTCAQTAPTTPPTIGHDARVFTPDRVARTLHGVWIGKVSGEFDPQLVASDGYVNVDYYMVVDVTRGESFVYEEFTDRRSGTGFTVNSGAPKWSYVWCAREDYQTKSPRQVHEFTKVSNNVNDARRMLNISLGLQLADDQEVVLSDIWKRLVDTKFFDNPNRSLAYAGVLFKPLTMGNVQSYSGGSLFELRLVGEYRGSGQTAAQFTPGSPIHNVEQGRFLGLSMSSQEVQQLGRQAPRMAATIDGSGDFLTAARELGNEMIGPKADAVASVFSTQMAFDKVVIGPLAPSISATLRKPKK
jgi:hypothetical protein